VIQLVRFSAGVGYVAFSSETEMEACLRRSRNQLGNRKIVITKALDAEASQHIEPIAEKPRPWEYKVATRVDTGFGSRLWWALVRMSSSHQVRLS